MKKSIAIILTLLIATTLFAQKPQGKHPTHHDGFPRTPQIEKMVSDLSVMQKKKLETITTDSKKRVEKIQNELNNIRNQIRTIMQQDGDNSAKLFPLLDREGVLQADLTKEMYNTRLKFDEVLTPEQLKEFRSKLDSMPQKHHPKEHNRHH